MIGGNGNKINSAKMTSLLIFTLIFLGTSVLINVQGMLLYPPRYQPELDQLSLEKYIRDDYLFNMHINCLFFDGPCDPVGRWMKPRMASYFLSSCILCTPNQEKEADKFMTWLYENHPQLFRIGIGKYLDANGITLPQKSKFREQVQKMNVPKVAISSIESGTKSGENGAQNTDSDSASETLINDGKKAEKIPSSQDQNLPTPSESTKPQTTDDEQEGPSQRVSNTNARKNKFSSAIAFSHPGARHNDDGGTFTPPGKANKFNRLTTPTVIEDDEAEMDFKFYHNN